MTKIPTWKDFQDASPSELKKAYKIDDRQLENAHRKHLDGASSGEYRANYETLYRKNRGDS